MNLIHNARDLNTGGRKVCLAIGVFDGVHLGHQQVIRQTVADAHQYDALALVVTFDRHPQSIVAPDKVPPFIYSRPQKLRAIESLGAEKVLEIHFDETFSRLSGEEFIRSLAGDLGQLLGVCVGADFVFGYKRSGNVALLKQLGAEMGFQVHGMAAVALDSDVISSTRIRKAIRDGNIDAASQMLGRPYSIAGVVTVGDRLGRQLGFPTANLDVTGLVLPPNGVYSGCTKIGGKFYRTALNIGVRPTVASGKPELRVEAHLIDFEGDLYGTELEVELGGKLRNERKFDSVGELREQIAKDVAAVR